jgi:DnaJ-class molecular chaperone
MTETKPAPKRYVLKTRRRPVPKPRVDCRVCGGDGFSIEGGPCRACDGSGVDPG